MTTAHLSVLGQPSDARMVLVMQLSMRVIGWLCLALGVVVGIGWWFHLPQLVQIHPEWAPMQANTACGFALIGISLLFSKMLPILLGALALLGLVGIGTLAQYVTGINLGIDTCLVSDPFIQVKTSHPGRMSPTTATAFSLLALAGFLNRWRVGSPITLWIIGTVWSMSAIALLGYLAHVEIAYNFGLTIFTKMAFHTASGMLLGSTGFFLMALLQARDRRQLISLRPIVCAAMAVITIGLSLASFSQHAKEHAERAELSKKNAANIVDISLSNRTEAIGRLVRRSFLGMYVNESSWRTDVQTYLSHYPDLVGVSWRQITGHTINEMSSNDPAIFSQVELSKTPEPFSWTAIKRPGDIHLVAIEFHDERQALIALFDPRKFYGDDSAASPNLKIVAVGSGSPLESNEHFTFVSHGLPWTLALTPIPLTGLALGWPLLFFGLLATLLLWWVLGNVTVMSAMAKRELERNSHLEAHRATLTSLSERLSLALAGGQLGAWDYDIEQNRLTWDERMYQLYGQTVDQFSGAYEAWHHAVHPADRERAAHELQQAINGAQEFNTQFRIVKSDGSIRHIRARALVKRNADGKAIRVIGANWDITREMLNEAERASLLTNLHNLTAIQKAILDSANLSIIATDTAGIITQWNASATRMLQWTPEEMIAKQTPAVIHVASEVVARASALTKELGITIQPGFDAFVAKSRQSRQADEQQWTYVRKDGSQFPVLLSVTTLVDADGAVVGYLGIGSDITERVRYERDIKQAMELAEAGARTKAEFLATMSHEIRTPMNGVIGMTNLLVKTQLDPQQREYVETVRSCGENLLTLINDILDFSKLEAGRVELEAIPLSIVDLTEEVVLLFQGQSEQKGIQLSLDIKGDVPATVEGDPTRIRQVLLNLISNALKFTLRGSVTVTVSALRQEAGYVDLLLMVSDTGVGMTPDQVEHLGEAFTQADSTTTRRFGGTGLGMSICKALIHLMRGELVVESQPNHGSTFRFHVRLPISQGKKGFTATYHNPNQVMVPYIKFQHILVADDNRINQRVVCILLKDYATVIDVVDNGAQAVAAVAVKRYDAVLMDCQMPELDGYQATRAIRAREAELALPRLPIIALTAHALEGAREECLNAGMDDYLSKPVRENDLVAVLIRLIANRGNSGNNSIPPLSAPKHDPLNALRLIMSNDDLRKVAEAVLRELPRLTQAMDVANEAGDRLQIARIAHNFKGSAAGLELKELHQIGRELESQAQTASAESLQALIESLMQESARAVQTFKNFLDSPQE
jgi:signal transduction histidine kinase/DNA-binding response OmpR family regulator